MYVLVFLLRTKICRPTILTSSFEISYSAKCFIDNIFCRIRLGLHFLFIQRSDTCDTSENNGQELISMMSSERVFVQSDRCTFAVLV